MSSVWEMEAVTDDHESDEDLIASLGEKQYDSMKEFSRERQDIVLPLSKHATIK